MAKALAALDWGRWVVECPHEGCMDAVAVDTPNGRRLRQRCAEGHLIDIEMPENERAIVDALATRPAAQRSWFPEGHARAAEAGLTVGATAAELREESEDAMQDDTTEAQQENELRDRLAALGVQIGPDGTFSGRL